MVHAAHNGHIKVAFAQAVDGLIHRSQRRGAGGVHRKVGAVHVKHIGYAAGNHVGQFAGHRIFVNRGKFLADAFVHFVHQFLFRFRRKRFIGRGFFQNFIQKRAVQTRVGHFVFHPAHRVTDNYRTAVTVKLFFVIAAVFQSHTRGFNGQVLHGIHLFGNLRRNAVFNGVKFKTFGNKAADFGIKFVFGFVIGAVEKFIVPIRLGNFGDAIFTSLNVLPELIFAQSSGHNGADADNGNRLFGFIVHFLS